MVYKDPKEKGKRRFKIPDDLDQRARLLCYRYRIARLVNKFNVMAVFLYNTINQKSGIISAAGHPLLVLDIGLPIDL